MPKEPPKASKLDGSAELPDNVQDCHNLIKDLFVRVAELEKQISRRNRAAFGRKSAKVDSSLLTGTGKVVHTETTEELSSEKQRLNLVSENKKGGGRSAPPAELNTREEKHVLDEKDIPCPCCGEARKISGFDVSYQIEFVRMVFENIKHTVFKYACEKCGGKVVAAAKPYQPIDKGIAGPGLLAKVATDKFWLHQPLYRQEQVFKALSIPVNRSSMCRWLKEIAELLSPIVERMRQLILKSRVAQSDATTLPVIKRGLGKTHKAFVWAYRGDISYSYVYFDYSDTEHSRYPERVLSGFNGILQTDGTNKYNGIIENGATSANCWAHVHCYFEDAWKEDPAAAELPMGVIKSLFDIERVAIKLHQQQ